MFVPDNGPIVGVIVATCTAAPLLTPYIVTIAVKIPVVAGFVSNVTVRSVAVAAVTVPAAPKLNTTWFNPGATVLNQVPVIVIVRALIEKFVLVN